MGSGVLVLSVVCLPGANAVYAAQIFFMQRCLFFPGPPNLGLFWQKMQTPRSRARQSSLLQPSPSDISPRPAPIAMRDTESPPCPLSLLVSVLLLVLALIYWLSATSLSGFYHAMLVPQRHTRDISRPSFYATLSALLPSPYRLGRCVLALS